MHASSIVSDVLAHRQANFIDGCAHLVGDGLVTALDEQVGDRAVEVQKDRPGGRKDGGHLIVAGHGWYGRTMVVQTLSNQRVASATYWPPAESGSPSAAWWNSRVSLPI